MQPTFPVHIEYNTLICRKASTTPCSISSNVSIIHRGSTVSKTAIALSIGGSAKLDIQGDYVYSTNAGEALDTSVLAFGLTTSQGSRDTTYCKFNYISNGLCYFRSNFLFEFAQADILELKDTVGIGICNGTCNALTVGNELLTGYINYIGKIHVLNMNGGLFCAHTDLHTLNMSGGDLYLSGTARYAFTKTGGNFYGRALGKTYDSLGSTEYTFVGDSTGVTALAKLNAIATATLAAITAFSSAGVELFSVLGSGIIKIRESSTTITAAANYLQLKASTTGKLLATTSSNVVGWLNAIVDHTPTTGDVLVYDGINYTANSFLSIRTGAFSNATGIQLDRAQTYYNNYTVNAPLAIAKAAGDVVGGFADITLVADGTNIPTISWATMATNSALYNNTAAAKNHYMFFKTANGLYYSIENL